MWSHPTHSTEIFPDAEDVNTITSARTALIDARKLLHEIRKRLIDGIGNAPVRKKAQAWGSAQSASRNWKKVMTLARHADNSTSDKKGSASPHTVEERGVDLPTASTTSMERLALDEAEAMRSTGAMPAFADAEQSHTKSEQLLLDEVTNGSMPSLPPDSTSSLPDVEVVETR